MKRSGTALQLAAAVTLAAAGIDGLGFVSADERLNQAAEIEGLSVLLELA